MLTQMCSPSGGSNPFPVPGGVKGEKGEAPFRVARKETQDMLLRPLEPVEDEEEALGVFRPLEEGGKPCEAEAFFPHVKRLETDSPRWMRQMASAKRGATVRVLSLGPSWGRQVSVAATSFTGLLAMRSRAGPT